MSCWKQIIISRSRNWTHLQFSTQCSNGCQCIMCNFQCVLYIGEGGAFSGHTVHIVSIKVCWCCWPKIIKISLRFVETTACQTWRVFSETQCIIVLLVYRSRLISCCGLPLNFYASQAARDGVPLSQCPMPTWTRLSAGRVSPLHACSSGGII